MIVPTAEQVRLWSDAVLDDHLRNCYRGSLYKCAGCIALQRAEIERAAVAAGMHDALAEGAL